MGWRVGAQRFLSCGHLGPPSKPGVIVQGWVCLGIEVSQDTLTCWATETLPGSVPALCGLSSLQTGTPCFHNQIVPSPEANEAAVGSSAALLSEGWGLPEMLGLLFGGNDCQNLTWAQGTLTCSLGSGGSGHGDSGGLGPRGLFEVRG